MPLLLLLLLPLLLLLLLLPLLLLQLLLLLLLPLLLLLLLLELLLLPLLLLLLLLPLLLLLLLLPLLLLLCRRGSHRGRCCSICTASRAFAPCWCLPSHARVLTGPLLLHARHHRLTLSWVACALVAIARLRHASRIVASCLLVIGGGTPACIGRLHAHGPLRHSDHGVAYPAAG